MTRSDDIPHEPTPVVTESVGHCLACGDPGSRPVETTGPMMHPQDGSAFTFRSCTVCGLVRLDPRVPAPALGAYYRDDYLPYLGPSAWGRHASLVARDLAATDRARVATVTRFAQIDAATRVWDVGCGKPTFLEALVRATGCSAVGTDFSDAGWRDEPGRWQGLRLSTGDPGSDPFDVVTMWHYLEHDYEPRRTLQEVAERARPGATLVIEVPDHDSWTRRRYGRHWAGYHTPRHTALYTPATLRTLLVKSGWQVVHQEARGTLDPYALDWMSRMERRGIDWGASMAPRFTGFVMGMLAFRLRHLLRRGRGLGIQTAVARRG